MLSAKPWKTDAIARLLMSGLLCVCAASVVVAGLHHVAVKHAVDYRVALGVLGSLACYGASLFQISRPWTLEEFLRRMLLLMGPMFAGLVLSAWVGKIAGVPPPSTTANQMMMVEAAGLMLFARFVREHGVGWAEAFGYRNRPMLAALYGVVGAILFIPLAWTLQKFSLTLMARFHVEPHEQQAVEALRASARWSSRVSLGVVAIVFAPVVEETLFRGILYPAIKQAGFPRLAFWGASLLFALAHYNVPTFLPLLALALLLTFLYELTDNLLAPILAHSVFNTLNFILLYLVQG